MTDDVAWGPWVDHDGQGCPDAVVGRFIHVESELVTGAYQQEEALVTQAIAGNPMWDWGFFGVKMKNSRGEWAWVGKILRYRIRKDRAVELMKAKAAALDCVSPKVLSDV